MKDNFYSYLDSYNKITIIYPKNDLESLENKKFYILIQDEKLELNIFGVYDIGNEVKYLTTVTESIDLNIEYAIIDEANHRSILRTGAIVRTDLFEMLYTYTGDDLGVSYTKEATTFKVWSPISKEIELELVSPKGASKFYELTCLPRGVWSITLDGDYECYKYRYHVRLSTDFRTALDPYAVASDANSQYDFIIDPSKLYQFKYPKPEFSGKPVDAIIYELHVRDYSIDPSIKNAKAGTYLGLLEHALTLDGHPTGVDYLKELGITHVQLQPIYDFGGVDDIKKDELYNWGYNPVQYNVPDGWFSENPNDPYSRINELRQLIDEIHHAGMRVTMDVVYNHVYEAKTFSYNRLVPGYFFHYDDNGMMTNVSGCNNDFASEKKMGRKLILDSIDYWVNTFNLDGFRFDLMGLLDIETMNQVTMIARSADPTNIVYGEGWNMPAAIPEYTRANMSNYAQMPQIGFFNDRFRDTLKGSQWTKHLGFASGGSFSFLDVLYLLTGSTVDNYLFASPNQSVNYVECHDNYTFYDFVKTLDAKIPEDKLKDYAALAIQIVLISQGVPFIHAGQEFFRTKKGVENSYKSSDEINMIDWTRADENWDNVLMVRDLISIRKDYSVFHYDRKTVIKDRIRLGNDGISNNSIRLSMRGIDKNFTVIIKNDYRYEYVDFKEIVTLIFDGRRRVSKVKASLELEKPGVYIVMEGRE